MFAQIANGGFTIDNRGREGIGNRTVFRRRDDESRRRQRHTHLDKLIPGRAGETAAGEIDDCRFQIAVTRHQQRHMQLTNGDGAFYLAIYDFVERIDTAPCFFHADDLSAFGIASEFAGVNAGSHAGKYHAAGEQEGEFFHCVLS